MSTQHDSPISDAQREQLVAYLDGELASEQARQIEERLAKDPALQQELQSLERSWDVLDELPHVTVGEDFSKSTIEMTTLEAQREVNELTQMQPVRKRRVRRTLLATAAAALVAGFLFARANVTGPDRTLLADLPVIWRVDALVQAPSPAFLSQLAERQPDLLSDYKKAQGTNEATTWVALESATLATRRAQIRQLSKPEQDALAGAQRRFLAMSPTRQTALREAHQALLAYSDQPEVLHCAALAYGDWLSQQPPGLRLELQELATDEAKLAKIEELRRREAHKSHWQLSSSEASRLRQAVRQVSEQPAVQRLPTALRNQRERFQQAMKAHGGKGPGGKSVEWMMRWGEQFDRLMKQHPAMPVVTLAQVAHPGDHRGRWVRSFLGPDGDTIVTQAQQDWAVVETELLTSLDDETQQKLSTSSPAHRAKRLRKWILATALDALEPGGLEDFFASDALTDLQRNELLALPREEMYEALRQHYFDSELGGIDPGAIRDLTPILRRLDERPRGGPPKP